MNNFVAFLTVLGLALTIPVECRERHPRQIVITQRHPTPDRSVYARRNFAEPGVVSDVYEVYVGPSNLPPTKREAVVVLQGNKGVEGVLSFMQERPEAAVFINGTITGLTPGPHGFHIHEKGDLRQGCTSAAGHFNPFSQPHGSQSDRNRHIGDLGNIQADATGTAEVRIADRLISLVGVNSILGRSVVVHEKEDDLGRGGAEDSLKTGNAGGRLACGVIGLI